MNRKNMYIIAAVVVGVVVVGLLASTGITGYVTSDASAGYNVRCVYKADPKIAWWSDSLSGNMIGSYLGKKCEFVRYDSGKAWSEDVITTCATDIASAKIVCIYWKEEQQRSVFTGSEIDDKASKLPDYVVFLKLDSVERIPFSYGAVEDTGITKSSNSGLAKLLNEWCIGGGHKGLWVANSQYEYRVSEIQMDYYVVDGVRCVRGLGKNTILLEPNNVKKQYEGEIIEISEAISLPITVAEAVEVETWYDCEDKLRIYDQVKVYCAEGSEIYGFIELGSGTIKEPIKGYDTGVEERLITKLACEVAKVLSEEAELPEDGASTETECTDSDGGKDYYEQGTTGGSYTDYCNDENSLTEFVCAEDGKIDDDYYECPNGCDAGACLPEDSDLTTRYRWEILVATGKQKNAGTEASISITAFDDSTNTGWDVGGEGATYFNDNEHGTMTKITQRSNGEPIYSQNIITDRGDFRVRLAGGPSGKTDGWYADAIIFSAYDTASGKLLRDYHYSLYDTQLRWLEGIDEVDMKTSTDTFKIISHMVKDTRIMRVCVYTSDVTRAGTDGKIFIMIDGKWIHLDNAGKKYNDFERGKKDCFYLGVDKEHLLQGSYEIKKEGGGTKWHLDKIEITMDTEKLQNTVKYNGLYCDDSDWWIKDEAFSCYKDN